MSDSAQKPLEEAALRYLERFSSSTTQLRRVLLRRVRRIALKQGTEPDIDGASVLIDAVIQKLVRLGLLDDQLYAATKAGSLHRRGASARKIAATLAQKGVPPELIKTALDSSDTDEALSARPGGDMAAAVALARRRRLGPYRSPETREAMRQKDLGSLARNGFSRQIAERLLACADADAAVALIAETD